MTATEALSRIQEAARRGRYFIHPHCWKRMGTRSFDLHDVKRGIANAQRAEPYSDSGRPSLPPGTTLWRLFGTDLEGDELILGIDLTSDHLGDAVVVTTAF